MPDTDDPTQWTEAEHAVMAVASEYGALGVAHVLFRMFPDLRRALDIEDMVERSSLGTPEAKAARDSVPNDVAARVVARAKELDAAVPSTYLIGCMGTVWHHNAGQVPCPQTFTWEGHADGAISARDLAYAEALDAGWTIRQNHAGQIQTLCPGLGDRLPVHLLSNGGTHT